jgi:uncharacterized phage-associated protein
MAMNFEVKKSIHLLLFVLQSLGGKANMTRIFLMFYFADLRYLAAYGKLGFGNFYLAMRQGPVPYNIFWLFLELNNRGEGSLAPRLKHYFEITDDGELKALVRYESDYLTMTEVNNLFSVLQLYKALELEDLQKKAMGPAWQSADAGNLVSVVKMAEEVNVDDKLMALVVAKYRFPIVPADDE